MWVALPTAEWMSMTPDHKAFGQRWVIFSFFAQHGVRPANEVISVWVPVSCGVGSGTSISNRLTHTCDVL